MIKYKEFKVSDFFNVVGTRSLDEGKLKFVKEGINFVGRVNDNNGVKGKIQKQNFEPNSGNTITCTVIGNYKYVKFQKEPYYCSQNINKLTPKFEINELRAMFFMAYLQKFVSQYDGMQSGYKLEDLKNHIIKLPVDDSNKIDFKFIDSYISKLEENRIGELTSYLIASGLINYNLNSKDINILNQKVNTKKYKLEELFEIKSPPKRFNANAVKLLNIKEKGAYRYIVRTSQNNGQRGYIKEDVKYLSPKNSIAFGQDTATVFYQDEPYFTGDKIKVMTLKKHELNEKIALYLLTLIRKAFITFSWGQTSFNENVLKSVEIDLPIDKFNNIDYKYMEDYIYAQQKIAISDVIKWKDIIINKTRQIIK